MTLFAEKVYKAVRRVPKGGVTTYAAVAWLLGAPGAARAVGNALNKNLYAPRVPCHRVVHSDGRVGGFAQGTCRKIRMLQGEGIEVLNGRVNLERFGNPAARKNN